MNKMHLVPRLEGSLLDTLWSESDLELFKVEYSELLSEGKTGKNRVKTNGFLESSEKTLKIMIQFHEQLKRMYEKAVGDAEEISILNQKIKTNKPILTSLATNRQILEVEVTEVTKALNSSQLVNSDKKKNLEFRDGRLVDAKEKSKQKRDEYDGILETEKFKKDEVITGLTKKLEILEVENEKMRVAVAGVEKGQLAMKNALNSCSDTLHTTLDK